MKDIAVQFEKIDLDYDKCIFKPITIIWGELDKENNVFINECGIECSPINGADEDAKDFFFFPTTIEELRKVYGEGEKVPDDVLLSEYFYLCTESCYIGKYSSEGTIELSQISFDEENNTQVDEQLRIYFTIDDLQKLKKLNSLPKIQQEIDRVIDVYNKLLKEKNKFTDRSESERAMDKINDKQDQKKDTPKLSLKRDESKNFNLALLRKEVLSKIVAQDRAVNSITNTLAVNYTSKNPRHKSHILVAGPTGTGKTEMIKIISEYLGIPCFKADSTSYTKEGYVGKSVQSMLTGLVKAANGDVEKAQNGILVIDEIDKKATGRDDDVAGKDVLYSLLKMMDRTEIEVNTEYYKSYMFDTSNLTIICMGAFEKLYKEKMSTNKNPIGFSTTNEDAIKKSVKLTNEDFIGYGMPAEFMGRIGSIVFTDNFAVENLVEILYKSKISPIREEKEWFEDRGVKLHVSKGFCEVIAQESIISKTGARDLKRKVSEKVQLAQEYVQLHPKVKEMRLTKQTALDPTKFYAK